MLNMVALFVLSLFITSLVDSSLIMVLGYVFTFILIHVILGYIFTESESTDE